MFIFPANSFIIFIPPLKAAAGLFLIVLLSSSIHITFSISKDSQSLRYDLLESLKVFTFILSVTFDPFIFKALIVTSDNPFFCQHLRW